MCSAYVILKCTVRESGQDQSVRCKTVSTHKHTRSKTDEKSAENEIFNFHECIFICSGESELSENVLFNYACLVH